MYNIELPCKVGDMIKFTNTDAEIQFEFEVEEIVIDAKGTRIFGRDKGFVLDANDFDSFCENISEKKL